MTEQSAAIPNHEVVYNPILLDQPIRELLSLSQSDVAANAGTGLSYAAAAYDLGRQPQVEYVDKTAAGEAAAKATQHSARQQAPLATIENWIYRSYQALPGIDRDSQLTQAATSFLAGRSLGVWILHNQSAPEQNNVSNLIHTKYFGAAKSLLRQQARLHPETRHHRYHTMASWQEAAVESFRPGGSTASATSIAIGGIAKALHSRADNNLESGKGTWQPENIRFIGKHIVTNVAALALGVTRPLRYFPEFERWHSALALKLLS